jgi:hypothetical protein
MGDWNGKEERGKGVRSRLRQRSALEVVRRWSIGRDICARSADRRVVI